MLPEKIFAEWQELERIEKDLETRREKFKAELFKQLEADNPHADSTETISVDIITPSKERYRFNRIANNRISIDEGKAKTFLADKISLIEKSDYKINAEKFENVYSRLTSKAKEIINGFVEVSKTLDKNLLENAVKLGKISQDEMIQVCKNKITYSLRVGPIKQETEITDGEKKREFKQKNAGKVSSKSKSKSEEARV